MPIHTDKHGRHTVEFQLRGHRVHRRCPSGTTKAQADALEVKLRREIFAVGSLGLEPTVDLPAAIADCLVETAKGTSSDRPRELHAFALVDYVEGRTLQDIPDVAEAYRADARASGLAVATINNRLNVLKKVAKWAWRKKLTRENLSARVPLEDPHNERHEYAQKPLIARLVDAMQTRQGKAWVALAVGTGLRGGALHELQPAHVRDGAIYLPQRPGKKRRGGMIPVAEFAKPHLAALPFTMTRDQLDQEWRVARTECGVPHLHHHDLRHSYASLLANKGVPLNIVGELLGHLTPKTTQRYSHFYDKTLRQAVKKIG